MFVRCKALHNRIRGKEEEERRRREQTNTGGVNEELESDLTPWGEFLVKINTRGDIFQEDSHSPLQILQQLTSGFRNVTNISAAANDSVDNIVIGVVDGIGYRDGGDVGVIGDVLVLKISAVAYC
ncbi:Hypothetical predicted protein [Octopus vulgaris]|uniref:Uncharacterized protein n=1 Tax=Octopus vulgaris TaxID=6645 RepID=A0AA36FAM3_OCTVU|nr:Hypothetical predicted protein [Octopus vulgaris]